MSISFDPPSPYWPRLYFKLACSAHLRVLHFLPMSGVLLALLVFSATFLSHLGVSHLLNTEKKEWVLVCFMVGGSLAYLLAYPEAIGLIQHITGPTVIPAILDFISGLAAMGFLVLGYVEFWSIIERSFSLRILIDATISPCGLAPEEIASIYSGGQGLEWMMNKRIEDLVASGMLIPDGPGYQLSDKGRSVGRIFLALHRGFRIA